MPVLGPPGASHLHGRSAGVGVIRRPSTPTTTRSTPTPSGASCAAKVVHRQESSSAEYAAQAAGTSKRTKATERWEEGSWLEGPRATGVMGVCEVDEFRVSPNVIRELPRGQAVVIARPESQVELVDIAAP